MLDAQRIGVNDDSKCPHCGSTKGAKLSRELILYLAKRFFVWGTLHRCEYGAAPVVQFNQYQKTNIAVSPWLEADTRLIGDTVGVGFFHYGPRLWMIGEVTPLFAMREPKTRQSILARIVAEYPLVTLDPNQTFYRIRKAPAKPSEPSEYDSPPIALSGTGRLDSAAMPVMYGSQDLQICVHECRVTADDELYLATLFPTRDLRLLDLTHLLEEDVTEFESLDMAVHMLFLAGNYSYEITRALSVAIRDAGFDGIVYPSYFSLLRIGAMPFETVYGLSRRIVPQLAAHEQSKAIPNLALFGRPIESGMINVRCINKLVLSRVEYEMHFGPVSV